MSRFKKQSGFTIIELTIATSVFAVVLLAAQAGFVEIGRLFYKGVSTTQTQQTASNILTDIKSNIQTAASISLQTSGNGYTYYCVGNTRYTVNINHEVDLSNPETYGSGGNFGLLRDTLTGSNACAAPCDPSGACPAGTVALNNPSEMLSNKMRLMQFDISQPDSAASPNLYNVSLIAAYGDNSVLSYTNQNDITTVYCNGSLNSGQFCSVSRLNSSAFQGVGA